jgi:probable phosphoglycerate mutase
VPLAAVYSSPLERALATASPIASTHALDVCALEALNEVDFGEWTGLTFKELSTRPGWRDFNESRRTATVPGGERAIDVQHRIVTALDMLRQRHPAAIIAVVTHAEVIRAAVLHATATPLDLWHRVEIHPASITTMVYDDGHTTLLAVNEAPRRFALNVM